jgi:hypothetical protein
MILTKQARLRHYLNCLALVSEHHRLPHHLRLLEDMNDFRINNRYTLGRTAIYLLLYDHMVAPLGRELISNLFLCLGLTRELHTRWLRSHGMSEELAQIEPCKLVADWSALGGLAWATSIPGKCSEFVRYRLSSVFLCVIVWTVRFVTRLRLLASMNLIVEWMIFLLLPSMSTFTSVLVLAAINGIILNECLHLPVGALLFVIIVKVRLSAIVLPIVCIDAGIPGMCGITVWTPNCLEVEHIEIRIFWLHLVKKVHSKLPF